MVDGSSPSSGVLFSYFKINLLRRLCTIFTGDLMAEVELTKMSSRGQIVIPQSIRDRLRLREGETFAVIGGGDTLVLKRVSMPSKEDILREMERLVKAGNVQAKKLGIKEKDVPKLIHRGRGITE